MREARRQTYLTELILLILFLSTPNFGAQPEIAWQSRFDQPASPTDAKVFFEPRGSGKSGDDLIIREVSKGVLRYGLKYGLKYDLTRSGDRLNMLFGDCVWWEGITTQWGPFDLARYPFVEIKWRSSQSIGSIAVYYALETASGGRAPSYGFFDAGRKETDDQGSEWNVSVMRLGPPSAMQTPGTPVKLLGLNFAMYADNLKEARGDVIVDIAYIRIRGFTDEEALAEKKILVSLRDFPKGRWRGFDSFFPFGVYDVGFLRGDFESWDGDYEGAFATYAQHYFNYIASNYEIQLVRMGAHKSEEGFRAYLSELGKQIERATATGVKLSGDVRDLLWMTDLSQGYQGLLPVMKRVVAAVPTDDALVSWQMADEPSADKAVTYAMMIRAVRESDPLKRPELLVFNNTTALGRYSPYLSIGYWDSYPVLEGSRDPWAIRDLAREYRKIMPDKPVWAVLQAFDTRPPIPKGSYVRPSDSEMRLMTYLSLSEGVKGLIWFVGWSGSGRDEGMVERAGTPRGGMMDTLKDLARRLIPIGRLLLGTNPLDDSGVQIRQLDEPAGGRGTTVSVLKHRDQPVYYLVAVNEDLDHTRKAQVNLPAKLLGKGCGVYDLYCLDGKNLLTGGSLTVNSLAGGDGRIYLVSTATEMGRQRAQLQCEKALEEVRVLTFDITIARRWKVPVGDVDASIEATRTAARAGNGTKALESAEQVKARLTRAIESNSELNAVRRALSDIQRELAEVSRITEYPSETPRWWTGRDHPMLVPNPAFLEQSKKYWTVGRRYRDLKLRYFRGDREGLWPEVSQARLECLKMREDVLAMLREKLKPAEEAPTK